MQLSDLGAGLLGFGPREGRNEENQVHLKARAGIHRRAKWLILKHGCKDVNLQAAGLLIILL